jgi:hypothetical protein
MRTLIPLSTLGAVLLLGAAASAVMTDWTFVGNPGNPCDRQSQGCFDGSEARERDQLGALSGSD